MFTTCKNESFPGNSAVLDIERSKLKDISAQAWQTDDAVGYKSWGYIENDSFKSVKYLVNNLIDIVSKNGHLLLNIGPRLDGTVPDEEQKTLPGVGSRLAANGEAIYGTRPWKIYGEGPTPLAGGSFSDNKDKPFTADDIRFTNKEGFLYAISLDVPKQNLLIKNLAIEKAGMIKTVELIEAKNKVNWTQPTAGLNIHPSVDYPSSHDVVYKIMVEK